MMEEKLLNRQLLFVILLIVNKKSAIIFIVMFEFLQNINIKEFISNHPIIINCVLSVVAFFAGKTYEKFDKEKKLKKDNIYSPLYKMFDDIKNDYFNIEELKSDFEYLDTEKWDEIEHSENNLFISNKLRDLMGKFFDTYMNLLDVWENCVKSVIDQYNIIAKEVNGLEELCTEERKSFIMNYDSEILQMQKFTFALVFKKYEMAFDYIIPNKKSHIRFEGVDDNEIDSYDLVINNKENIIERFKSIKIDDAMMKSYNSLKNKVEEIIKYLSKEIRK